MSQIDTILTRNLADIQARIADACCRSGLDLNSITMIAVTKYVDASVVDGLIRAGVTNIGENRLQVAEPKFEAMKSPTNVRKHFIGPLQTNKARRVLELFDEIHSLDRMGLADAIQRRAVELGRTVPCFVEVNIGGEDQKAGFAPSQVFQAIRDINSTYPNIELKGLMCIPPASDSSEASRLHFKAMKKLVDNAVAEGFAPPSFTSLSMGMSSDFEVAIEEGATHVRVGTALYRGLPGFEEH